MTEEAIRRNFLLLYELLDEIFVRFLFQTQQQKNKQTITKTITNICQDYGYPQGTQTEMLKAYVYNEPQQVESGQSNPALTGARTLQNLVIISPKKKNFFS